MSGGRRRGENPDGKEEEEGHRGGGSDDDGGGKSSEDGFKSPVESSLKLRLDDSDSSSRRPSVEVADEGGPATSSQSQRLRYEEDSSQDETASTRLADRATNGKVPKKEAVTSAARTTVPNKRKRGGEGGGRGLRLDPESESLEEEMDDSPRRLAAIRNKTKHTTEISRRRKSMRLVSRLLPSHGCAQDAERDVLVEASPSKRRKKSIVSPEGKYGSAERDRRRMGEEGRAGREEEGRIAKPSTSSTSTNAKAVGMKSPRNEGITVFAAARPTKAVASTSNGIVRGDAEAEGGTHASQFEVSPSQSTVSQRGRRRLLCLDDEDLEPSQELITPVTPNPEERRSGPYTEIFHPPPPAAAKRKNGRGNRELLGSES